MNVLLVFATNSGGTQIVAELVSSLLTGKGHSVTLKNPTEVTPEDLSQAGLRIFASPSWDFEGKQGQPHIDYLPLFEKSKGLDINKAPCAVLGLGDSSYSIFCGCADHLENFVKQINGTFIVETIRIDGYFFNQQKNDRLITEWATNLCSKIAA